ncbi:unnamed protein product [Prorocentrum cordatum]|uniref:RING-type E3 ubiquitin transferase n=1 Tax=Prorocentrum cordatum TaxID=2364126 RepID=A0ABN9WRN6_9DINO|nr:unnamed protein product [Polarella glacialis]
MLAPLVPAMPFSDTDLVLVFGHWSKVPDRNYDGDLFPVEHLRFTHDKIRPVFGAHAHAGSPLYGLVNDLCAGRVLPAESLPPLEVYWHRGAWRSLSNRRLWALKAFMGLTGTAHLMVRVRRSTVSPATFAAKNSTESDGQVVEVTGNEAALQESYGRCVGPGGMPAQRRPCAPVLEAQRGALWIKGPVWAWKREVHTSDRPLAGEASGARLAESAGRARLVNAERWWRASAGLLASGSCAHGEHCMFVHDAAFASDAELATAALGRAGGAPLGPPSSASTRIPTRATALARAALRGWRLLAGRAARAGSAPEGEGHLGGSLHRWKCEPCNHDVCFSCHPPPGPLRVEHTSGCTVSVAEAISGTHEDSPEYDYCLPKGSLGVVRRVDDAGDILVCWHELGDRWVLKEDGSKLHIDPTGGTGAPLPAGWAALGEAQPQALGDSAPAEPRAAPPAPAPRPPPRDAPAGPAREAADDAAAPAAESGPLGAEAAAAEPQPGPAPERRARRWEQGAAARPSGGEARGPGAASGGGAGAAAQGEGAEAAAAPAGAEAAGERGGSGGAGGQAVRDPAADAARAAQAAASEGVGAAAAAAEAATPAGAAGAVEEAEKQEELDRIERERLRGSRWGVPGGGLRAAQEAAEKREARLADEARGAADGARGRAEEEEGTAEEARLVSEGGASGKRASEAAGGCRLAEGARAAREAGTAPGAAEAAGPAKEAAAGARRQEEVEAAAAADALEAAGAARVDKAALDEAEEEEEEEEVEEAPEAEATGAAEAALAAEATGREARSRAERKVKKKADLRARREAEQRRAREEQEQRSRAEAERREREAAERLAEQAARLEASEKAERKAKKKADLKAKKEAEQRAKREAERRAREEQEQRSRAEAERRAREAAERLAEQAARRAEQAAKRAERASQSQAAPAVEPPPAPGPGGQEPLAGSRDAPRGGAGLGTPCRLCERQAYGAELARTLRVCKGHFRELQGAEQHLVGRAAELPKYCCHGSKTFSLLHVLAYSSVRARRSADVSQWMQQVPFLRALIRLLLLRGADPLAKNALEATPLDSMVSVVSVAPHVVIAFLEEICEQDQTKAIHVAKNFAELVKGSWSAKILELFRKVQRLDNINSVVGQRLGENVPQIQAFLRIYSPWWPQDSCERSASLEA